jgi:uncharacterized protein involved in exopolysaccharide biosynthesis
MKEQVYRVGKGVRSIMDKEATQMYDDEIDIRELIIKLWDRKIVILGVTLAAALIAGLVSIFAIPTRYQATATVTLSQPTLFSSGTGVGVSNNSTQQNLPINLTQFYSSRLLTASDLLNLASSSDLLRATLSSPDISHRAGTPNLTTFQSQTSTQAVGSSLIQLQVTEKDPQMSAALANVWAALFVQRVNNILGISDGDIKALEAKQADAKQTWDQAEGELSTELKSNQSTSLNEQFSQEKNALDAYLGKITAINLLISEVQRQQTVLGESPQAAPLQLDQALNLLSLEQSAVGIGDGTLSPQVQLTGPTIFASDFTVGKAQSDLEEFSASLNKQKSELEADLVQIENKILVIHTSLELESYKVDQLTQNRDQAKAQYLALGDQLQQMQMFKENVQIAQVASPALPPEKPISRNGLRNVLLAGVLGLMLSVFGVLALDWWRNSTDEKQETKKDVSRMQEG